MLDEGDTGHWMIVWEKEFRIKNRIACEELGYPASEALYSSTQEWEEYNGLSWNWFVASSL